MTHETKTRTYSYSTAQLDLSAAMQMTGLEYMLALADGQFGPPPSISDTLNFSVPFDLEYGKASVEAEPADFMLNPLSSVHGGFAAALLDTALGISVHTALPKATGYTTAELSVNYVRPMTPDMGRVRADGVMLHIGRTIATAEAKITGVEDGKLYAHGTTTCLVFPLHRPGS